MKIVGVKGFVGTFAIVFLFSQMNLPENVVNKSTYDYVVNLSKFSFSKYDSIEDENIDRFISTYKAVYFDKKKVVKRMRSMSGRRIYKRVEVLVPRKDPRLSSLSLVEKQYFSVPSDSPYKPDIALLYADVLIANTKYSTALKVLASLSNTSVYDEAVLRMAKIGVKTGNYHLLRESLSIYEKMKKVEIYSPIYIVYKALLYAKDGNLETSLRMVRDLVVFDFTQKYDYISYIVDYFHHLSGIFPSSFPSGEGRKMVEEICFELIDYKFYGEAVKIANFAKLGPDFIAELLLDMKVIGARGWKTLARIYLPVTYRNIILNPVSFENRIDGYGSYLRKVILKSLVVHYIKHDCCKSTEYLRILSGEAIRTERIYLLASKLIDKLILAKRYDMIALILKETELSGNFAHRDIDRVSFFKGYACEMIGQTNDAIKFYETAVSSVPSGYYDYLASRRISELASENEVRSYYNRFILPTTSESEKLKLAKLLFNFDKQNYDSYKSFVLYKIKEKNPFLLSIPYEIVEAIDSVERSKIKTLLKRIKDEYAVVSRIVRNKVVYKGLSNVFSYIVIMRNRLEMKMTRGIYNEGNNITANKFIDAFSKFLPFSIQEVLYPIPYVSDVIYSAERFGIDPNLIYAVMKQESFFQEGAYSRAGAIGLMQVLYSTGKLVARKLDIPEAISSRKDLFKTDLNIFLGTAYLSMLIDSYGDLNHAISAYNGGARVFSRTKRKYKISPEDSIVFSEFLAFRETRQYIKRVVKYYNVYSSIYNFEIVKKELGVRDKKDLEELKARLNALQEKLGIGEEEIEEEQEETESEE
ncbi:MAG: lytic transglycosylase domain-containing protein [Brevinematia bacterium]